MQILTKRSKNMLYLIIMVASLFAKIATSSAIPRARAQNTNSTMTTQPKKATNYLKRKPTDSRRYVAFYPGLTS